MTRQFPFQFERCGQAELVVTHPLGSFELNWIPGRPTIFRLPSRKAWPTVVPAWAAGMWYEHRLQLAMWCRSHDYSYGIDHKDARASPEEMDVEIAAIACGERPHLVGGDAECGLLVGEDGGSGLMALSHREEILMVRFDEHAALVGFERYPYLFRGSDARSATDACDPEGFRRALAAVVPGFAETPTLLVRPFRIDALRLELSPFPGWAKQPICRGGRAVDICRTEDGVFNAAKAADLEEWLDDGCCELTCGGEWWCFNGRGYVFA